jgi:hypothetical protein
MKTLRTARWIIRIRIVTGYLAIAAVTGLFFHGSKSLADRIDQLSAGQAAYQQSWIPNACISVEPQVNI